MFEVLSASRPPSRVGTHRYLLSVGFHSILLAGAVALTRPPAAATHTLAPEPDIVFVAPQPPRSSPPATRDLLPGQTTPAPPPLPPSIALPDLAAPVVSARVPTVADVLTGASIESGAAPGATALALGATAPGIGGPLTAAAVDDPVEVLEQPTPQYPSALAQAGIPGRVELEYVVDTLGRAEPGSVRTLTSTHPAFEEAARASVLASRYRAARSGGRVVRQLVRQTLSFRSAD